MITVQGEVGVQVEYVTKGKVTNIKVGNKPLRSYQMPENHAQVAVELGLTKNLGNYESLRVNVTVKLPAKEEDVADKLEEAKGIAEVYLQKFVKEATS